MWHFLRLSSGDGQRRGGAGPPDSYGRGVYGQRLYFRPMDIQYDPEREALAAMKLAAEAHGAERLRWINAALAWIEITRLRAPARDRLNGGALGPHRCARGEGLASYVSLSLPQRSHGLDPFSTR